MKKLLALFDTYFLKFSVLFTLAFIALYPKLPSIHIIRTWVYIRLEDFSIAIVVILWLIQLLRRKVKLPLPVGMPIGIYWGVGFLSLLYTLIFVGPHLVGFFPHLAILEYLRRIEYMVLFFIAFSTVRSVKDLRDYVVVFCLTLVGIVIYGFGQRYYLDLWALFPKFFEKYSFCFPSFQTGNEEFAKGLALCLPKEARIPSTFGGHYDLAAYLVIALPILLGIFFSIKKRILRGGVAVLFIASLALLLLTASRISFFAYLLGALATLIFLKRKKWIVPVFAISAILLVTFSSSTAKRLLETFRVVSVVTNNQGQVVGIAQTNLPDSLKNKVSKTDSVIVEAPPPTQNLPTGSSFITLPTQTVATTSALVKTSLNTAESLRLKLANGGLEISTISGSFLIQKALVYDISFTTRFQAEWPNAWAAFMSDPVLGKGYSTITLASDNDYLRLLGESGALGFISFILIFVVFGIFLSETVLKTSSPLVKTFSLGLAGGVIGLFANASLIDVFEASKVAETLWILLGVSVGALSLEYAGAIAYLPKLKKIFTHNIFLALYLLIPVFVLFGGGISNFFVGDDFVWLKWAANTNPHDFLTFFTNAEGFFYRPLDKIVMYLLYTLSSFQPHGYHIFDLFVHFFIGLGVYMLGMQLLKKKLWAWLLALIFIALPIQSETLFWISTISISLSSLFMVYSLVGFVRFRQKNSIIFYIVSLVLFVPAVFSYEMAVILPIILFVVDLFFAKTKKWKMLFAYIPFVLIDAVYLFLRSSAHVAAVAGDYSYKISHLPANFVGNFIGYMIVSVFGERALSYQMTLRTITKSHATLFELLLGTVFIAVCFGIFTMRKRFTGSIRNEKVRLAAFGFVFAFVALLPFLGLGNMSERYGYFATIGFAFVLVAIMQSIYARMKGKYIWGGVAILVIVFIFWKSLIGSELSEWQKASDTTYLTLGYFRVEQMGITGSDTAYVANVPIRYGNAWIFPVGLPEGLWFIYRDNVPHVVEASTVADAKNAIAKKPSIAPARDYIFLFNKNGEISQVQ